MMVVPGLGASDQFTLTPSVSVAPATVNFSSPTVDSEGNAISSWSWNFGDGTTTNTPSPSHIYTAAGTYFPTLVVTNSYGFPINAPGPSLTVFAPTSIGFTASPTNGTAPLTVNFTSPAVDSAGNAISSWNWIFGDGATSAARNPTHTYTVANSYSPVLLATNSNVLPVSTSGPSVTVFPVNIAFTASPTTGAVPLTVNFRSASFDNELHAISSWNWDFGDGTGSAVQSPSHIYTTAGTYVPTLMATNNLGIPITGFGPPSITATNTAVYAGLVLNGGFETGQFSDWTTNASPGNSINFFVDNGSGTGISPHSGKNLAALGSIGSLSYLTQTLPTSAGARYLLSLWLNSPDGQTPNEFQVSWNGTTLFDATNIPAIGWTNLQFFVNATGGATALKFGFQDDPWYLGLDDVSVVSAQPGIGSLGFSGTNLVLNGLNGFSGGTYYVLMSTNVTLPLSQWTRVATNVPGANGNFTITVNKPVTSGAAQRYYVVQLQ
jgi:PKD repeat protein